MQTAFEHYGCLPKGFENTLEEIRIRLKATPNKGKYDQEGSQLWSCHAIVRVAQSAWDLTDWDVQDGVFARPGQEHSWLQTKRTSQLEACVLDIYPVAAFGGPLLVNIGSFGSPWLMLYKAEPWRYTDRLEKIETEVAALRKELAL